MRTIVVVDYDSAWPSQFEALRAAVEAAVGETALAIEHIGSTSVPGLCAKPVIDLDVVVEGVDGVAAAIEKLAAIGYRHRGDLGIEGREAFASPHSDPRHHLYVCPLGNTGLRNHLAVRDCLRSHPELAAEYGQLKKDLARRFPQDIDAYMDGKTEFLLRILDRAGFAPADIRSIRAANQLDRLKSQGGR